VPRGASAAGLSALTGSPPPSDDAAVLVDWLAVSEWGLLLAGLLGSAIVIGLLAARLFLRATDSHTHRR